MYSQPNAFVQRTFPPTIGCLTSQTVEQICQKNNLSFVELLRPFCTVNAEHRLRDPTGSDHTIKNLQICIQDVNDAPPQPSLAKRYLNESVSNAPCEVTKSVAVSNSTLDIPTDCKWFHAWSKTFLSVQYPSDHEFTKHLLGCLLVMSTGDPPETLHLLLQSLQQMQTVTPSNLPKWFSQNIFKYYVLVHDAKNGDKDMNFFNSIKNAYGPDHCFFLEINSQHHQTPSTVIHDYWALYVLPRNQDLDSSDHGSSPRTPAEVNSLGGMPNNMSGDIDVMVRSGGSPELAQEVGEGQQQPVVFHPLSPDLDVAPVIPNDNQIQSDHTHKVVNANVWTGVQGNYQHGNYLTPQDVGNIKNMIRHLVTQSLIPHVERQISHLNELTSNKKGVSRSLLSATKRLFSTSKSGPGSAAVNSVIYVSDAPELQLRRLGDLYFMFTNYSMAFQAYHSVKRDFTADQAYKHLAGALEMAALSAFMQGDTGRKALEYMEEAILTYLSCKLPQFATRATLLSTQFLKDRQMFGEAAKQLIRMTSEDSDLRSALLLEQASYCFLHSSRPNMFRKYAFHMVLAGHRFSKAGQRKHALRCYRQAFQVYQHKGWSLAEDHIHFTIGRLAGHLKLLKEGSASLSSLLSSGNKQTQAQQITYLREYLQMLQQLNMEEPKKDLNVLPLPTMEENSARVLVSASPTENLAQAFEPDSPADSIRWSRMEELAVTESQGAPMIFRPTIYLFTKNTANTTNPVVVTKETVHVQVCLKNPLQIPLPLVRVRLLWEFHRSDGEVVSNATESSVCESFVQTNVLNSVNLAPNSSQEVILTLIPQRPGQVNILGMLYVLTCSTEAAMQQSGDVPSVQGKQMFIVRGPKVKLKKEQSDVAYEKDNRLNVKIIEALPLLQVDSDNFKSDMLCGEIKKCVLRLKNTGNAPLRNLYLVTSSSKLFSLPKEYILAEKVVHEGVADNMSSEYGESYKEKTNTYKVFKIALSRDDGLNSGEELNLPLWMRAPDAQEGLTNVKMLFYYETFLESVLPRYRVTRFSKEVIVRSSLQLRAVVSRSNLYGDKDTMNIAVTVKNIHQSTVQKVPESVALHLVQISLATRKWELQPKAICSRDLNLNSHESCSFIIRASRSSNENNEITDVRLRDDESVEPGGAQPYYDFYRWHIADEKDPFADNLYKMVLCLRWKAQVTRSDQSTSSVLGLSHLTLTELAVPVVSPADLQAPPVPGGQVKSLKIFGPERRVNSGRKTLKKANLENALSYILLHEHKREHPFRTRRICRVEMKLVLRNCVDFPLRIMINTPGVKYLRPTVMPTQLYTPHSSSTFNWASRSNAFVRLDGNESCSVVLAAAFTAPGTYDLGSRLTVAAAAENDVDFTVQHCSVESSIIISEV